MQRWLGRQLTDRVSGREDFQQICEDSQVQGIVPAELCPGANSGWWEEECRMEGVLSGAQPSPGASKPQSAWHHLKCCETGAGPMFRRLLC